MQCYDHADVQCHIMVVQLMGNYCIIPVLECVTVIIPVTKVRYFHKSVRASPVIVTVTAIMPGMYML